MSVRRASVNAVVETAPTCSVSELGSSASQDVAVARINGRYPEAGFAVNRESDMVIRVTLGIGIIATKETSDMVTEGDTLFIDKQTPYYYEGNLEVMLVSSPPWLPDQYEHIEA